MSWEKLGDAVRLRRKQLGLTQADVATRGGPSVETLRAVENNRAGRLSRRSRRALERAVEWEAGSVDEVLSGGASRVPGTPPADVGPTTAQPAALASDHFAMAEHVVNMQQAFARHHDSIPGPAREALEAELIRSARESEESIIKIMPWLGDEDRGEAIRILAALRGQ